MEARHVAGRPPVAAIERILSEQVQRARDRLAVPLRDDEQEIIDGGTRSFVGEAYDSWRAGNLVGTPEQVAEKIQAYVDLGCTGFYPWCSDYPETETLRLLAEQVMPEVRRANAQYLEPSPR